MTDDDEMLNRKKIGRKRGLRLSGIGIVNKIETEKRKRCMRKEVGAEFLLTAWIISLAGRMRQKQIRSHEINGHT